MGSRRDATEARVALDSGKGGFEKALYALVRLLDVVC